MKGKIVQFIVIIIVVTMLMALAVFLGYNIIKDKLPNKSNNNTNIQEEKREYEPINNTDNIIKYDKEENKEDNNKKKEIEIKPTHNKLMVVAHPDDDTIFGGAHLIEDDYTVVCVTCGVVKLRLNEFKNAMNYSNDKFIYLGHTDVQSDGYISNWNNEKDKIRKELLEIVNSQDWDLIVVHNPEGEYGHKQHKMTSKIVTDIVENKDKLYYFGKFQVKGTVDDTPTLSEELFKKKKEMLAIYKSQPACTDKGKLTYAFDHENWVKYSDWK